MLWALGSRAAAAQRLSALVVGPAARAHRPSIAPRYMRVLLLLVCAARTSAAPSWDGDYFDPDELKISISRSGSSILAHSADWEISGSLTSETRARLAGLDGLLSDSGVAWSNGVVWSRQAVAVPLAPPTWPGSYHASHANIQIRITQPSDTKVFAEGTRCAPQRNPYTRVRAHLTRILSTRAPAHAPFVF